jgi:colanic acid/amylovoran biosynthesis glycosyltransferase
MFLEQQPFDVFHAQFGTEGLSALRFRRLRALRTKALVVHLRGWDISSFVDKRSSDVYDRLFREADLMIANCAHFRHRAISLGCPPEKIVVIGSPIDTDRFAPPPSREPLDGRDARLVAVGRLVEKKGFADAIDAVAILIAEGRKVRLDVIGEGGTRADLETRIARHGLGDRVTLHGAATSAQVLAALHRADIALAPSVTASSGDSDGPVNTAKEAMATGLPIIATRHGGIPELVIPGENGDLVPERDPVALAAAIARMIDNWCSWEALGRAGRRKVVTDYGQDSIIAKTLSAYRTSLRNAGAVDE